MVVTEEESQPANATPVNASQGGQNSASTLPLKRAADSSLENHVSKQPKSASRDNHDVSTFLADMQQRGIEMERLYAFLQSLPSEDKFVVR
jgi:hypothetical protein